MKKVTKIIILLFLANCAINDQSIDDNRYYTHNARLETKLIIVDYQDTDYNRKKSEKSKNIEIKFFEKEAFENFLRRKKHKIIAIASFSSYAKILKKELIEKAEELDVDNISVVDIVSTCSTDIWGFYGCVHTTNYYFIKYE